MTNPYNVSVQILIYQNDKEGCLWIYAESMNTQSEIVYIYTCKKTKNIYDKQIQNVIISTKIINKHSFKINFPLRNKIKWNFYTFGKYRFY